MLVRPNAKIGRNPKEVWCILDNQASIRDLGKFQPGLAVLGAGGVAESTRCACFLGCYVEAGCEARPSLKEPRKGTTDTDEIHTVCPCP